MNPHQAETVAALLGAAHNAAWDAADREKPVAKRQQKLTEARHFLKSVLTEIERAEDTLAKAADGGLEFAA